MRRPRFGRWIRFEVLQLAGTTSFNLRKLAARVQRENNPQLKAALMLHAHENNQLKRLMSYIYDEDLAAEYVAIEQRLGPRSIEQLALRGTPMMSLPEIYRDFLIRFEIAYHTPERVADEKVFLRESTIAAMMRSGASPTEVAHALNLDPGNMNAYLIRGDTGRFTLETAQAILDYVA